MTELKQLRDFAEQVNGIRPKERSLKGVVNNLISNYKGGGGSGMNVIDLNGITIDDFNEGFYNQIMNSFNEELPSYIKNFTETTHFFSIVGLVPVVVNETEVEYEEEDHDSISFYFMYSSQTFNIVVLDNDYVRMTIIPLVEEE